MFAGDWEVSPTVAAIFWVSGSATAVPPETPACALPSISVMMMSSMVRASAIAPAFVTSLVGSISTFRSSRQSTMSPHTYSFANSARRLNTVSMIGESA